MESSAQEWYPPEVIAVTPLVSPVTAVGTRVNVYPQQLTAPVESSAQVWYVPALRDD